MFRWRSAHPESKTSSKDWSLVIVYWSTDVLKLSFYPLPFNAMYYAELHYDCLLVLCRSILRIDSFLIYLNFLKHLAITTPKGLPFSSPKFLKESDSDKHVHITTCLDIIHSLLFIIIRVQCREKLFCRPWDDD